MALPEVIAGIVIAKAEPEPGGFCLVVLSDGRLLCPIPDESSSPYWTSAEASQVFVGSELEMVTTGCDAKSMLLPHCNNDLPCLEVRRSATGNRISTSSACKAVATLVTTSIDDAWPKEFMSNGSHRHLLPGMDVPSVIVLRGSISCIYEVSLHFAAFNSQHRADLQLGGRSFGAIPVICADLQVSPLIANSEGYLTLGVSRPAHQGDGAYSEQELCAVFLLGFLPFRNEWEQEPPATGSLNTSVGSELRSDMSTLASSGEVRFNEDIFVCGNWGSSPATNPESGNVAPGEWKIEAPGNWLNEGNLAPGDWKNEGPGNWLNEEDQPTDFYVGWVVQMRDKFCMVECPDAGYQMPIYVHRNTAPPSSLQMDDVVTFRIHTNRKGQPQASPPLWKLVDAEGANSRAFGKYIGQIRRIGLNGMGLVACEEVENSEGVWLGKDSVALGKLCVGDTISFNLEYDGFDAAWVSRPFWHRVTGESLGRDADPEDAAAAVVSGSMASLAYGTSVKTALALVTGAKAMDGGTNTGSGKEYHTNDASRKDSGAAGVPRKGSGKKGKARIQGNIPYDGYLVGRVKRREEATGFTFVKCPEEDDVCIDKAIAERAGLQVNDIVCFKVRVNNFGLPQAQSPVWKFLGEASRGTKLPTLGTYTGSVSMALWNGSGLVKCPEVFALCGEHAYVTASDMHVSQLGVGDTVSFEFNYSSEGRPVVARGFWKSCSRDGERTLQKKAANREADQDESQYRGPHNGPAYFSIADQEEGRPRRKRFEVDDWTAAGDWDGSDDWMHSSTEDERPPLRHPLQHRLREDASGYHAGDWSYWADGSEARAHGSREDGWPPRRRPLQHRLREEVWEPAWEPEPGGWSSSHRDAHWGLAPSFSKGGSSSSCKGGKAWSEKAGAAWSGMAGDAWFGKGADAWSGKAGHGSSVKTSVVWPGPIGAPRLGPNTASSPLGPNVASRMGKAANSWSGRAGDAWSGKGYGKAHDAWHNEERGNGSGFWLFDGGGAGSVGFSRKRRQIGEEEEGWSDVLRGIVKSLHKNEGYCVADFQPSFKQPVYVSSYAADLRALSESDAIACLPFPGSAGMLEASPPVWKLMGGRTIRSSDHLRWFGDFHGIVSYYKETGAYGFVRSNGIKSRYGKDAYIHKSVIERCGLVVGDKIVFNVHVSADGHPQVSAPLWKRISP